MGCCISSNSKRDSPHYSHPKPSAQEKQHKRSPHVTITSPPQASLEEETVKEVLSETPITKPPPQSTTQIPKFQEPKSQVEIFQEPKVQAQIFQEPRSQVQIFTKNAKEDQEKERTPEISQASEICSIADTYSTATTTTTTTITEIREDHEVTSKKRIVNNRSSPSNKIPRKRPYNGDRDRVPKRRNIPVKKEYSGQLRSTKNINKSNVGSSSRVGRDLGERSGRRSRSPASRGSGGGVVRGEIPAKVTRRGGARAQEVEVGSEVKKGDKNINDSVLMQQQGGQQQQLGGQQQQQQQGNESLENPLVSLECFIFL